MMDFSKYGNGASSAQVSGSAAPQQGVAPEQKRPMGPVMGLMQGIGGAMQKMVNKPGVPPKFAEMFNKSPFSKENMDNWAEKLADRRAMMEDRIQARRAEMTAKRQAFQEKMKANPGMNPWGRMGN